MTTNDNGDGAIGVIGIFAGNDAANGADGVAHFVTIFQFLN